MKSLAKKTTQVMTLFLLMLLNFQVKAQQDLSFANIEDELRTQSTAIISIINLVIVIGLALGLGYSIYEVVTGKRESNTRIVAFGAGLVLYVIGWWVIGQLM